VTYQSPGVYIEEVPSGPQPISAVSTSVVAVLGTTRKGPVLKPTRVTSWSDFVRTFGNATSRSFTAESVFGYFENGGPAAWVVRVDPSAAAAWTAVDIGGDPSFEITASSPGTWGNAVRIAIAREEGAAKGSFFRAAATGPATVVVGTTFALPLASTAGLRAGDRVTVSPPPLASGVPVPVDGTIDSVLANAVNVTFGASVVLPTESVVASSITAGSTIHLPAGKGFKTGDVVVITAPDGARTSGVVASAVESGSAVTLTLESATTAVQGAAYAQRRTTISVNVDDPGAPIVSPAPPSVNVALSRITFPGQMTKPVSGHLTGVTLRSAARIVFGDGRDSTYGAGVFKAVGPIQPIGEAQLTMGVFAELYSKEGLSIEAPDDAKLADAFQWVPAGTILSLTGGAVTPFTAKRNAGSTAPFFTIAGGPPSSGTYTKVAAITDATAVAQLLVRATVAPQVGDAIVLGANHVPLTSVAPSGDAYVIGWNTAVDASGFIGLQPLYSVASATVESARFSLAISVDGATVESFTGLSLSPTHASYFAKDDVVNGTSSLITVAPRPPGADPVDLATMPHYVDIATPGGDSAATTEDYRKALVRLEAQPEPAMVICPDAVRMDDPLIQADLVGKIVTHCEQFRRFAIVDAPNFDEDEDSDLLGWRNSTVSSTYAAVYAPHLSIVTIDPNSIDRFTTVPPSGFVAGVFARTDRERGVHKAPGNERVSGTVGLAQSYTQRRQDPLNDGSVNLIRAFPGRGTRIWGARNATDDTTWRYVNVRRLFNMIENSVDRATQWVVFEPNTASTWVRVKVSVENFLDQQWRAGALAGTKPEQAYRVRVGLGETMTEADIDLGLVITEVAIAPAKPAEFVVFRFSHKRLSE